MARITGRADQFESSLTNQKNSNNVAGSQQSSMLMTGRAGESCDTSELCRVHRQLLRRRAER